VAKTDFELFEEWAVLKHHYQTVEAIGRFKILRKSFEGEEGHRPILSAATMAMLDKRQDED
jgi:hypothetical protein